MNIILIGATGGIGKSLSYELYTNNRHTIYLPDKL